LIFDIWNYNDELQIKFYTHRTCYSYASVVDSSSYQDVLRQYCFLE